MTRDALLLLADGTAFHGPALGPPGTSAGEAVFYTGMTGYEEALTDPSYAGQLLVFTYPLIGNYGVDPHVRQHRRICAAGGVFRRVSEHPSHYRSVESLPRWLDDEGVRGIEGIDTRALVTRLREAGTMRSVLAVGEQAVADAPARLAAYLEAPLATPELVESVSVEAPLECGRGAAKIALLDCGCKANIATCLESAGATVVELPYHCGFDDIVALKPDGLVISNGPGDPSELGTVVDTLRRVVDRGTLPTFGICLGHQLLALALGAKTYKMKYGHRGGNQPVRLCATGDVLITAHNHGYAVDATTLPPAVRETIVNLNDGVNEGLRHETLPIESVQFHPEASPGPFDARFFFARFLKSLAR
ncbi:MAG TPA: glutamine-hydrolyzing carbamoyl-phosphate synthase small subunit [Candidatus Eremiobacteraceae bacterium]|nr:glutamine-hydrolyzing carbamoyl-phosphate synthase small subunit [Candidatus Eremiobacteraceae bacterium]